MYIFIGGNAIRCKPPGYHLLVQCLHDSNFLRLLLHVVDEGCRVLDLYTPTPGIQELETLTLNVLLLLKRVLQLQVNLRHLRVEMLRQISEQIQEFQINYSESHRKNLWNLFVGWALLLEWLR